MNYKQALNRILILTPYNCIDPVQHIFLAWLFSKKTSRYCHGSGRVWGGGGGVGGGVLKLDIF